MGGASAVKDYWGYLIKSDKSPTPLFSELLLGIAHYIKKQVAPWDVDVLTPPKMANFYKLVGGNYDSLFLESTDTSIAFIYKSLGCFHSLQPSKDAFAEPSVPALTPEGFVRWQTVQLLLEPDMHVPFLQAAVKRFDIINPVDGKQFPRQLPPEALPRSPDLEMCRWEEGVREKLRAEADNPMPTPRTARHVSRPSDVESLGTTDSSLDDRSIVDTAEYFQPSPRRPHSHHSHGHSSSANSASPHGRAHFGNLNPDSSPQLSPETQERRRSGPDRDEPTPTHHHHPYSRPPPTSQPPPSHHHHHHRGRRPFTDASPSPHSKSRSPSPRPRHPPRQSSHSQSPSRYAQTSSRPAYDQYGRRHSEHGAIPVRSAEAPPSQPPPRNTLSPHFYKSPPSSASRPGSGAGLPPSVAYVPAPVAVPPNQIPQGQVPPIQTQFNGMPPPANPAQPGAFARGPFRASVGHGYQRPPGDWRGDPQRVATQRSRSGYPPAAPSSTGVVPPDGGPIRFASDEESAKRNRMRRRTTEEVVREQELDEMEFEKGRRRDRRGSGGSKSRDRHN